MILTKCPVSAGPALTTPREEKFSRSLLHAPRIEGPRAFPSSASTLVNYRDEARRLQMLHKLDLVVVDYLPLIQVTERKRDPHAHEFFAPRQDEYQRANFSGEMPSRNPTIHNWLTRVVRHMPTLNHRRADVLTATGARRSRP